MRDEDESLGAADDPSSSLSDLAAGIADDERESPEGGQARGDDATLAELAELIRRRRSIDPPIADEDDESGEWDFVAGGPTAADADALDSKTEAVLELVGKASNVLVSGSSGSPAEHRLCSRLMTARGDKPVNLLVIAITETPSQRLSVLENYLDGPVGETAVVDVQNYDQEVDDGRYDGPVEIRTVSNARDLRRIGIVTSKILARWEDEPGETTVCFHSLSDLLRLTDDHQRAFRFLHVLHGRVSAAGARAHYHFDPTVHQERTGRTFESLFDTTIQFDEDGSVSLP